MSELVAVEEMKTCSKCDENKPESEFSKHKRHTNGFRSICKSCANEATKAWQKANPEKVRKANKARYAANSEKARAASRARYAANPEKARAAVEACRKANPEKEKAAYRRLGRKYRKELRPSYIAQSLKMKLKEVTPHLLALKQEQLSILRLSKQLKKALYENVEHAH